MTLILIPVFKYSNLFIIFLYLWLYGMTMFAFGVLIGSFFSSGKTAAILAIMLFFVSSFISMLTSDPQVSEAVKTIVSFLPSVGVQLAGTVLLEFEASGIGITSQNINEAYENYRFATSLWMNVISFFVFLILGLYLENVLPASAGVRKSFFFPFTKSFWTNTKFQDRYSDDMHENNNNCLERKLVNDSDIENMNIRQSNFEDINDFLKRKQSNDQ